MIRWMLRGVLALVVLVTFLAGAGLLYRAFEVGRIEQRLSIAASNGIDEGLFAPTPHGDQWITIRGQDRSNPVLLFLHGGPGGTNGPVATAYLPYEKSYTVVQWDQPGAGKTFRNAGNTMPVDLTIATVVADGVAVAEFVKARLGVPKLVLVGISWGSIVGVEMARQRPDLFFAYVGTGQVASMKTNESLGYERVLAKARQREHSKAIEELEAIGPPPYDSIGEFQSQRVWVLRFAGGGASDILLRWLLAPRYSLGDVVSEVRGWFASQEHFLGAAMRGPMMDVDLPATATAFELPVVFIQGADDDITPSELAAAYFERLVAPRKAYVAIADAGHGVVLDNPHEFIAALDEHVQSR